jgi:hypothetical protein
MFALTLINVLAALAVLGLCAVVYRSLSDEEN